MSISEQVVLITGGARGIGAETAKALAAKGVRVFYTQVFREGDPHRPRPGGARRDSSRDR